jgi:hypothetical protein
MTISSSTRKAGPYSGNGSNTAFPFAFKVFNIADVQVIQTDNTGVESNLTLNTHYTISLNGNQNSNPGGTVNMITAPVTGYKITLTSSIPYTQTLDLTNQGGFYPTTINEALDRATIQIQQLAEQVGRSVKTGISSTTTADQLINTILTSASNAQASASAAGTSASSASSSATSASGSATSASASAALAQTYANQAAAASSSSIFVGFKLIDNELIAETITSGNSTAIVQSDYIDSAFVPPLSQFQITVGNDLVMSF